MQGYRAKLEPKIRTITSGPQKGQKKWVLRGWVPIRDSGGTITRVRRQHDLGENQTATAGARKAEADRLNKAYEDAVLASEHHITFPQAYDNYVDNGHSDPLYGDRIVEIIGDRRCIDIDDTLMLAIKKQIFKADAKASYVNRHLYSPVVAILNMALRENAPRLTRPKGHKDAPPISIPEDAWFALLAPHFGSNTVALLSFLTLHGRRLGDALGRAPTDFNPLEGTLQIGRDKNGDPLLIQLHPKVAALMDDMPHWRDRRWLFGSGPTSASNVRRDILGACLKASGVDAIDASRLVQGNIKKAKAKLIELGRVQYFAPHALGRHSFATRMLKRGFSLQYVKDSGGWKTIEALSRRYLHLEQKEWTKGVHEVAGPIADAITGNRGIRVETGGPTSTSQVIETK